MIPLEKISLDNDFNHQVMRRVKLVFYFKKLTKPFVLEIAFFVFLLGLMFTQVSIFDVFNNSSLTNDFEEFGNFWINAFYNTEFTVQIFSSLLILVGSILAFTSLKKTLKIIVKMKNGGVVSH